MSTDNPDEEVPVMVREFRGLRVEIGPRVQNEWRKVPLAEKLRLQESALAAWEKHDQRFKYGPINKAIEERQREKARLGSYWLSSYTAILHRIKDHELIELLAAFDNRDPQALRNIATRWERRKEAAAKRQETAPERERERFHERFHGLDITLILEWLNGLCLAGFSAGALELLLTKAGLWEAGKTVEGIRQRVTRLGLERLRRPIVQTKHVNIVGSTVKID